MKQEDLAKRAHLAERKLASVCKLVEGFMTKSDVKALEDLAEALESGHGAPVLVLGAQVPRLLRAVNRVLSSYKAVVKP